MQSHNSVSQDPLFVEVEFSQRMKHLQSVCGDSFSVNKNRKQQRYIIILSDGLGSGVKANILASMTATMASLFLSANIEIKRALGVIMDTLPVCQVRKISYATFTMIDTSLNGETRIIEMGNPSFLHIRDAKIVDHEYSEITSTGWENRKIRISNFKIEPEDRLVVMSDGITQAGLGGEILKLGWRLEGCAKYAIKRLGENPDLSARELAKNIVVEALKCEPERVPHDDMTCGVIYYRQPRKLLVATGPPFSESKDSSWAQKFKRFKGSKIICGGTTGNILSRELRQEIETPLRAMGDLPPYSTMQGADIVTEGILTLTRASKLLKSETRDGTAASKLVDLLLEHDTIEFCVGTKINEAHQDPSLPAELDIRRNIVKQIIKLLEEKYLKEIKIEYV